MTVLDCIGNLTKAVADCSASLTFVDGILFTLVLIAVIAFAVLLFKRRRGYGVRSISISLPFGLGSITYETTQEDRIVAWKLYTQLRTRKAALIFDKKHDVIADVYDSLYEIFPTTRDLLTNLPLSEIERDPSIADLVFRVQNDGIRPHLTKWQAHFRKWWDVAVENPEYKDLSPQEIQRKYPKYQDLVCELETMNLELNKYAEELLRVAKAPAWKGKLRKLTPEEPVPQAPA